MALVDRLVVVAEIDARRLALKKKLDAAPSSLRDGEVRLEQARADLARHKDDAKKGTLEVKRYEGEIKAKQQELEKTQTMQNQARSNDEYQAHGKKIAAIKAEIGELETRILEDYEKVDAREKEKGPIEKRIRELEEGLKVERARVEREIRALSLELEKVEAERREKLVDLDKAERALYERSLEKHGDRAVVPVVDNYCQGCLVSIRPNQAAQLRARDQLVTCWECGRILYVDR